MSVRIAPPVRFESIETIDKFFDYAETEGVSPRLTNFAYPLLGHIFKPEAIYEPGLREQITEHLANDGLLALFMKHHTALDPVYVAGTIPGSSLDAMRHGSVILAKAVLADNPLTGTLLTKLGIKPVVRQRDHGNPRFNLVSETPGDESGMRDRLIAHMSERNIVLGAHSFDSDLHVASFVEGGRQGHQSRTIQPENVHLGLIEMARRSLNAHRIGGICVAINSEKGHRHPVVAFSHFIGSPAEHDDETIKDMIAVGVQAADDVAAHTALRRSPQAILDKGCTGIASKS